MFFEKKLVICTHLVVMYSVIQFIESFQLGNVLGYFQNRQRMKLEQTVKHHKSNIFIEHSIF